MLKEINNSSSLFIDSFASFPIEGFIPNYLSAKFFMTHTFERYFFGFYYDNYFLRNSQVSIPMSR
jgi:hypothetical protein